VHVLAGLLALRGNKAFFRGSKETRCFRSRAFVCCPPSPCLWKPKNLTLFRHISKNCCVDKQPPNGLVLPMKLTNRHVSPSGKHELLHESNKARDRMLCVTNGVLAYVLGWSCMCLHQRLRAVGRRRRHPLEAHSLLLWWGCDLRVARPSPPERQSFFARCTTLPCSTTTSNGVNITTGLSVCRPPSGARV